MTLFSNYQEINDLFTIDFRKLVAEDCFLKYDTSFVIDLDNKTIKREMHYSLKDDIIQEINHFFDLIEKSEDVKYYSETMQRNIPNSSKSFTSPNFREYFNSAITNIVLHKKTKLDFRGCKTEEDRNKKIEKSKNVVDFYESEKLSLLDAYFDYLNMDIEQIVNYVNNKVEKEVIDYLTSEQAIDNISDSTLFDLSREVKKLTIDIAVLTERKKMISGEIVKMKQNIIIDRLVETDFTITDNLGNRYTLPKSTIEKVKSTLQSSFTPKKYLKI